jgi:hypothetical protein
MILQQRLTETQWRAEVDKMRRWGAAIDDDNASALIKYFVPRFGPDNDRFDPVVASPRQGSDPTGGTR